jgi:hypothetical protein
MKRRQEIDPMVVEITGLTCPLDLKTQGKLGKAFLSHILHMRGQISSPLLEMSEKSVNEGGSSQQGSPFGTICNSGHYIKTLNAFMELIQASEQAIQCKNLDIDTMAILFGASASSPREVYFLHFPKVTGHEYEMTETEQSANLRTMIHRLVLMWSEIPLSSDRRYLTFVALRPRSSFILQNEYDNNSSILSIFSIRNRFKVKSRNNKLPTLHTTLYRLQEEKETDLCHDVLNPTLWLVSKKGVKSMRK